ncbi:MAG: hypothetical protein AB4290_02640 [Spirulina sp.]
MQEEVIAILELQNLELIESRTRFLESYADEVIEESFAEPWMPQAASATALTQAAQSAWLLDDNRAARLLKRAASRYYRAGLPYGYFLSSLIANSRDTMTMLVEGPAVSMLEAILHNERLDREDMGELGIVSLRYPNQQVYLLLAFLSHREIANKFGNLIERAVESLDVHGTLPMGPQSVPLARYITVARLVWEIHRSRGDISFRRVLQEMSSLLRITFRYQESIELAMRNRYLWEQMQSPVELIDFDLAGLVTLVAGALSPNFWQELFDRIMALHSPLANIPIRVANSLRRQRGNEGM